jgi:hypothetical protein
MGSVKQAAEDAWATGRKYYEASYVALDNSDAFGKAQATIHEQLARAWLCLAIQASEVRLCAVNACGVVGVKLERIRV